MAGFEEIYWNSYPIIEYNSTVQYKCNHIHYLVCDNLYKAVNSMLIALGPRTSTSALCIATF